MVKAVRRVVTGHDASGKAVVVSDGPATNVRERPAMAGMASHLLWVTDETPADIAGNADRAAREIGVAPPAGGSILRVVDFPPETAQATTTLDNATMLRDMGLSADNPAAKIAHPGAHRTRSIDYAIVLSGEIDMWLDDSAVHLKAGDILIQQGTNHAWVNRGTETCRIVFVLIDAVAPPAHAQS
ncbi:MAG TPA: cupin domain-containing protein [Hyphomicrobiales bacterium]|nr:cupin domain-containing protein [Hyphomicrobiales bacterium]